MESQTPQNPPGSIKGLAARAGCVVLIVALVFIAGFLGFLFTEGIR